MAALLMKSTYLNSNKQPLILLRRCRRLQLRQSSSFLGVVFADNSTKHKQIHRQQQQHRKNCCTSSSTITVSSLGPSPFRIGSDSSPFRIPLPHHQNQRRYFSWWNPFSKSGTRDTNAVMSSARTKSESEVENPRKIQERKDLTLLMLATEFRNIAAEEDRKRKEEDEKQQHTSDDVYLENREKMIDMAFDRLTEIEIDNKSLMQLRYSLQTSLEEQVEEYFGVFGSIDEELLLLEQVPSTTADSDGSGGAKSTTTSQMDSYLEEILRLELERTIDDLSNTKRSKAPKGSDPKEFLTLKRGAIETILNCEGEQNNYDEDSKTTFTTTSGGGKDNTNEKNNKISWSQDDEFGYHLSVDQEKNRLIRYYQSINLCRSAKMRDNVGYSVIALRSSIPGAGRGVYVDGYARAGSILAFQPGKVWAKENLVNLSIDEERDLERNDTYQMSLRPDDYMVDSRSSPYTVLTDENSNLMALGHIVNHPTPSNGPNCRSAMFNFTQKMEIDSSTTLKRYIPNKYARPRNKTLMDSLWDRDVIEMHSLVLVATRDICNEEIFYDYRLASSHLPQWYDPVNDTAYVADPTEIDKYESDDEDAADDNEQEEKKTIPTSSN
ncbi:MAG: hypothetical protein ACI8RD_012832 [Bacillariaceae sp.]|jgi:hypothetical protein